MVGVCRAAVLAEGGDAEAAASSFADAHDELHQLAAATTDRARAAALLEDKHAAETAIDAESGVGEAAMRRLATSVRAAAASLGSDPGACP